MRSEEHVCGHFFLLWGFNTVGRVFKLFVRGCLVERVGEMPVCAGKLSIWAVRVAARVIMDANSGQRQHSFVSV